MQVVLLGASGFVGSAVLRALAAQPGEKAAQVLSHRAPVPGHGFVREHRGSLVALPAGLMPQAPHVVIHSASKQIDRDGSGFGENLAGIEALGAAVNGHTRGVIYASSFSVYGEGPQRGIDEDAPLAPQTELARSRAAAERRLARLARERGFKAVALRSRFVFGQGDRYFLPGLAKLAARRVGIGSGDQRYSVIDVDDYAAVILALARHLLAGSPELSSWQAFNLGYAQPVSFGDIGRLLRRHDELGAPRMNLPVRPWLLAALEALPSTARQLAARLRLLGLDHYGSVERLRTYLGPSVLDTPPLAALERAILRTRSPDEAEGGIRDLGGRQDPDCSLALAASRSAALHPGYVEGRASTCRSTASGAAAVAAPTAAIPAPANPMDIIDNYSAMKAADVGGKFASQARLRAEGVPVPGFFVLSRRLFDRALAAERGAIAALLAPLSLTDRAAIAAAAAKIHQKIRQIPLDPATTAAILAAYDKHHADTRFVSVRACMVCDNAQFSEDSASNPFAGISESFLYVTREQVIERVRDCWASAFAEKAIVYRLSQGIDLTDVSVAVGIQRMVFGERSFVMFSADPNTAARDTLIVAGYGIGEGVVQESVPVDHYFVSGKSGEIRSVIADKDSRLSLDEARGHGLARFPVDESLRKAPCLTEAQLRELSTLAGRIEAAFGWPQDMEGCFTAEGELFLLQARPIALDYNQKRVWTGLNVTESYPGISSPLTYSLARLFYRVIFRDLYKRLGVDEPTLHRNAALLDRMIGYVRGRVYYSLNAFYLLHQQSPLFPKLAPFWEEMVGLKSSYVIHSGEAEAPKGKWRRRLEVAGAVAKVAAMFVRHPRQMRQYKSWWIERAKTCRALIQSQPGPLALTEEFHRLWRDVGERWGLTLVNDAYIFTLYGLTQKLMQRWKLADTALLSNLLCGGEEVESVEIFLSILRIAEHVRADQALRDLFLVSDDAELVARYRAGTLPAEVLAMLVTHIARYGDRSMEELKVENPSLREDPSVLLRGIRRFVKSELRADAFGSAEADKRAQAEAALTAHFGRRSPRKAILRWMLAHLREVVAHRENSRYCRSELFGLCKDIFRAQGQYLTERGALARPDDVYCLTLDEIFGYCDGTGVDESFQDTVARRRAQLAEYAAEEIPDTLTTDGGLRDNVLAKAPETVSGDGRELRGLGSSMGVAAGTARVILDPNSVDELAPNSILVAKETDPGWLFLMLASSGMVVERGSMLSHTAITGRKFGIPTIVGVPEATRRIPDGAAVEMDGGRGVVKLTGTEAA